MKLEPEPHDLLVAFLLVQSLLERRSEALFQPLGLTGAKFNILNLLSGKKGRLDQAVLADLLLVGKSSTSIVLNRMVREGLIKREEHPRDRRQTVLILTGKGHALWRRIASAYRASVEEVFGKLRPKERKIFVHHLKTLHDALKGIATPDSFEARVFGDRLEKAKA